MQAATRTGSVAAVVALGPLTHRLAARRPVDPIARLAELQAAADRDPQSAHPAFRRSRSVKTFAR